MAKRRSLASRLNQKIEILEITIVSDGEGGWSEEESVHSTTWAEIVPATENRTARLVAEAFVGDSIRATLSHFVYVRRQPGITHTMRVRWTPRRSDGDTATRTADIRAITDLGDTFVLSVAERVN